MADGSVPLVLSPEPFSRAVAYLEQPAGRTLRAALVEAVRQGSISADDLSRTVVYVDGVRLERDQTLDHVLREGEVVNIVVEPLGGGGRKEIGQILMTIAVIAVSMWVGGGAGGTIASTLLARVAAAAVLTLGQAAVAAIFAPEAENKAKTNERYALQSASNQYRPWSAFPLALGEVVVAPDFAAKTYTQAVGDDVWIYGILGLHAGACAMSEMKIGDTLVSSMGAGDFRMAEHLTPGPRTFSIYPNDVDQLDLQEELEATVGGATPVIRAASAEGESFEFDFFLPGGLHFQKDDGRVLTATVTLSVRYRPINEDGVPTGTGAWSNGLTVPLSSTTKEPWRVMRSLSLPMGRYEFEIKRSAKPDANEKRRDNVAITAIRAIAFRKPVADETLSIVEFAVRATALNQGTLAPITCRIIPLCETWNGAAWTAPEPTSNPAALVRWLLTGPAPARPLLPEQADVRLRAWAQLCDEYDWKAGFYLIDDRRQADVLAMLEQAGRASLFWDGTQIVASAWVEKPAPRQLFTGTNLKDHRWTIVYPEPVHALRVEFQNIDEGSEPDELYVYADGYGETDGPGITAAVLVEALRLEGQKTAERAYRDGRWELGRRLHQRRIDTWTADAEHLVSSYGDRVRLAWQRVDGGTSSRVRCRRWTGGMVTGLRLSQPVEMIPGEAYAVDIRLVGEVIVAVPVINEADDAPVITREIQFAIPREPGSSPKRDDLIAFGVPTRISEDTEIIGIEPGKGLTASLTGVRYVAPLLMAGETGPIPPLQTGLSRQRAANPPAPRLLGVQPDPSGVRVSFHMPPWTGSPIVGFSARWRPTPLPGEETGWLSLPAMGASANTLVTPPPRALPVPVDQDDETLIDVEIRAVTASGQSSPVPLLIEGLAVRDTPFMPTNVSVTAVTRAAPDGSSHGVLVFEADALDAAVSTDMIVEVRRYPPGGGAPDAWEASGLILPANNPTGDILGLRAGTAYGTRAAFRTSDGWYSDWTLEIVRTVPAGSNVSGDVAPVTPANVAGVPSIAITTTMSPDGTITSRLWGDWADAADAAAYLVELSDGTSSATLDVPTSDLADLIVRIGGTYRYRVKGRSRTGHLSAAWSSWSANQVATGDATAPGPVGVVGGAGNGVFPLVRQIGMAWANPVVSDLARVLIYRNTSGTSPQVTGEPSYGWSEGTRFFDGQAALGTTYHYWALTQDRSGNASWGSLVYLGSGQARRVSVSADDVLATDPLLVTGYGIAGGIAGQGPGATAPANRVLNDRTENGLQYVGQPDGAAKVFDGTQTGQLQIVLPFGYSKFAMIKFDVVVSDLSTSRMVTRYSIAGYLYEVTNSWSSPFVSAVGPRASILPVKLGSFGGKAYVWIGDVGTSWYYPSVRVENLEVRYGTDAGWVTGWNVSFNNTDITSLIGSGGLFPLANSGEAVFGEGSLVEVAGGSVATRSNFRTDQGISQGIAGQGALATKSTANFDVDVSEGTTYKKYLSTERVKLTTVEDYATVGGYFGGNLRETSGGTVATRANFRTDQGIAGGIAGQGPGATAVANRVLNDRIENGIQFVAQPDGATRSMSGNQTGQIEITLPFGYAKNAVVKFDIVVSNLATGQSQARYTVSAYLYADSASWYAPTVSMVGPRTMNFPVKLGQIGAYARVWIGSIGSNWYYPSVRIENLEVRGLGVDGGWASGWFSGMQANDVTAYVTATIPQPRPGDTIFGEGIFEDGSLNLLATRANFRTDQGIAGGIAGQTAWATHAASVNRIQYLDDAGRIIDGRGLPLNAASGAGLVLDPTAPLSPGTNTSTQIAVAVTTVTLVGGQVISIAASTISGLTANTAYAVFYDLLTSSCVAISSAATSYYTSASRYLALGYYRTAQSGGTYSPPPAPPPWGGGGVGNCADEDALILMANAARTGPGREKRFGDLRQGDWIWTQHERTEEWGAFEVAAVSLAEDEPCCLLTLEDGRSLPVTPDHRVRVVGQGFVHAKDLRFGALVAGLSPSRMADRSYAGRRTVVKATISGAHTYVANGMLSHNIKYVEP